MNARLLFEKPLVDLEQKIQDLKCAATQGDLDIVKEVARLEKKAEQILCQLYRKLSPWEIVQVARCVERPHTSDYISQLIEDFVPLAGDRMFGEDGAIIGGLGRFRGTSVMVLGHEKGKDTEERVKRNFGMPRPEGYRKAKRLMDLAQRFQLPLITFVDTAGAHPGVDAEERGQSEAIASCIEKSLTLDVPIVSVIIGEGGSGGAIALATANSVMMLAYSIYSVISPEGCASILWRTREKAEDAAKALKITAKDLKGLGVIDEIIAEPPGAAHRNKKQVIDTAGDAIDKELKKLLRQPASFFKPHRQERFVDIGRVSQKVLKYKKA